MNPTHHEFTFPADRRLRVWIRRRELLLFGALALAPIAAACAYYLILGLPQVLGRADPAASDGPHGFPLWIRSAHYLNLVFLALMVRSGLQILMDHPRLYWNVHCTPGSEWARFTPLQVPKDRAWTSKQDSRYLSSWIGLPGGRHTVGIARHWHFLVAMLWTANGLIFATLLLVSGEWRRILPDSWRIFPKAWAVLVHYATFHMPPEPDGFYRYNSLQHLSYGAVVFVLGPLSILTGLAMSPALNSRFSWYARLFGNRQAARSIHFLLLLSYLGFTAVHVFFVVLTGLWRNMDHIVLGSDETGLSGLFLGAVGIGVLLLACVMTNWISWHRPRALQRVAGRLVEGLMRASLNRLTPRAHYKKEEISPYFWVNGNVPTGEEWQRLSENGFRDYRLRVYGLVEHPVELSLDDIRALGKQEQVTEHNCIQGWSGIAQWGGLPLSKLVELIKPSSEAKFVAFHSFGEGLYGGEYYDCHSIENVLHPLSLVAYEMNDEPIAIQHGAPLRLRVENQLGYKQVKWIKSIEFIASVGDIGKGFGGRNEDDEYYDLVANI